MALKLKFLLISLGLLLCLNVSAQTTNFKKGKVELKTGQDLNGFVGFIDESTIAFKLVKDSDFQKFVLAEEVHIFLYDTEKYESIEYQKAAFFVHELEQGNITLFEQVPDKNNNQSYYLKIEQEFIKFDQSNYYEILKTYIGDLYIFEQYDMEMFQVAFDYTGEDLKYLVNLYNQQFAQIKLNPQNTDNNRDKGKRLGFTNNTLNVTESPQIPNSARNELVLKTEVLYNQVLEALKEGDWKKINTALNLLKPLSKEIEAYNNNQFYQQLLAKAKQKDLQNFKKVWVKFVSTGVQSLIKTANQQEETAMRKLIVRQAFVEFLEIKTILQKTDSKLTQEITNQFKLTFANAKIKEQFRVETAKINQSFSAVIVKL